MRSSCRILSSVFALLVLLAYSAVAAPLAPAPVWQVDTGMADWLVPVVAETVAHSVSVRVIDAPAAGDALTPARRLAQVADGLRHIRYRRGGRSPASGFDCSGFVRYVFQQGMGTELPNTSAAQFGYGQPVSRDQLRSGDLVFFRTRGKRVSHVGIYLGEGRFIHAPSSGKTVSVNALSERYWAQRYAGARRPDVMMARQADGQPATS